MKPGDLVTPVPDFVDLYSKPDEIGTVPTAKLSRPQFAVVLEVKNPTDGTHGQPVRVTTGSTSGWTYLHRLTLFSRSDRNHDPR